MVVAAVGCEYRGDDGAGPAVLERVGELDGVDVLGALGSPLDLLGAWDGADLAIVIDALDGVDATGGVCIVDVDVASGPEVPGRTRSNASSHGLGVVDALRLAAVTGTAPARVVLVGVPGEDFDGGVGLSPAASRAVESAARRVVELAGGATVQNGPRATGSHRRDHRP